MSKPDADYYRQLKQAGVAFSLPLIFVSCPIGGYVAGGWIDAWAGTGSLFTRLLTLVGLIGGGYQAYVLIRRLSRDS